MNQPPAFQFYASDYLSSSKVQLMSLDERGAYVQLLCYNWQDGSIPSDIGKLAKLCGTNPKTMARIWESLTSCFVANDEPGRLVNPRLEEVRLEQKRFREKKSEAGRLGGFHSGESRREAKGSTASDLLEADAKRTPKQNEALQSPSPSPVSNKKANPVNNSSTTHHRNTAPSALGVDVFETLWAQYPNKDGRKAALSHFKATVKTAEDLERCLSALESYKAHLALHPQKPIKNGSTWFNNWRDWYGWVEPSNGAKSRAVPPCATFPPSPHFLGDSWQPVTHRAACHHEYECTDETCMDQVDVTHYCPLCAGQFRTVGASP